MKSRTLNFPGLSKNELHERINHLMNMYHGEIISNNVSVVRNDDNYNINASIRKFILNFHLSGNILVYDNYLTLNFETNIPQDYIEKGISRIVQEMSKRTN